MREWTRLRRQAPGFTRETMKKTFTSALDRLRVLPEIFTTVSLGQALGNQRLAACYLQRWRAQGLVESFGKTGVHFNLLRAPRGRQVLEEQALAKLFPSAVLISASVLHDAGWTTQIARTAQLAVVRRRSYPNVSQSASLFPRALSWYQMMHPFIEQDTSGRPPRLSPAGALVDGWRTNQGREVHAWTPDPDDLEIEDVNWMAVERAAAKIECIIPDWARYYIEREHRDRPRLRRQR